MAHPSPNHIPQYSGSTNAIPSYQMDIIHTLLREVREVKALLEQKEPEPERMYFDELRKALGKKGKPLSYGALNDKLTKAGIEPGGDTGGKWILREHFKKLKYL